MKIRTGFVSNSSSSSFVIAKNFISEEQIKQLKDWLRTQTDEDDYLTLEEKINYVACRNTYYCEPDVSVFLEKIGIDKRFIYLGY